MEVVAPVKTLHAGGASTTPYVSAPSSPRRTAGDPFDYLCPFTSAPTSPVRAVTIYDHFNSLSISKTSGATPSKAKTAAADEFAFDFSGELELAAADELFESGKIRPLKQIKAVAREKWTDRGREMTTFSPSAYSFGSRSRKGSRSLSPLRRGVAESPGSSPAPTAAAKGGGGGRSKKWRLRDLLLFRSASEGRATGNRSKDPLRKYTLLTSDLASRSPDNSESARSRRRKPAVSAHERHYTENRAAVEELKKKTALPYRQGLFGCMRLSPAVETFHRGLHNSYSFNRPRS